MKLLNYTRVQKPKRDNSARPANFTRLLQTIPDQIPLGGAFALVATLARATLQLSEKA
jgi:hypothetical protein